MSTAPRDSLAPGDARHSGGRPRSADAQRSRGRRLSVYLPSIAIAMACCVGLYAGTQVAKHSAHPVPTGKRSTSPTHPSPLTLDAYDRAVLAASPSAYWPLVPGQPAISALPKPSHPQAPAVAGGGAATAGPVKPPAAPPISTSAGTRIPYEPGMTLAPSFTIELWATLAPSTNQPITLVRADLANATDAPVRITESGPLHAVGFTGAGAGAGTTLSSARGLGSTALRQLAFTYDGATHQWRWFIDGVADTSGVRPGLVGTDRMADLLLSSPPASLVTRLAIYSRPLDAATIRQHYLVGTDQQNPTTRFAGGVALGGGEPNNQRRRADYAALASMNATWIRTDIDWQWLEQNRGEWNWELYDPVVADANAAGLKFLAILHTVPTWANNGGGNYAPPADLSLQTDFCYQAVRHYAPMGVLDYEIGNEVNLPHPGWSPSNGSAYASKLLIPCVTGVRRAAAELGVTVNVVLGSLVPTQNPATYPENFLADIYRAGGGGYFDATSLHPYTTPGAPTVTDHLTGVPRRMYTVMSAHGDGAKQIWATEFGYPTLGPVSISEARQATYAPIAVTTWYSLPYAGPIFWFSGRDAGTDPHDNEDHFGLLRLDGTPKAAYAALQSVLTR